MCHARPEHQRDVLVIGLRRMRDLALSRGLLRDGLVANRYLAMAGQRIESDTTALAELAVVEEPTDPLLAVLALAAAAIDGKAGATERLFAALEPLRPILPPI